MSVYHIVRKHKLLETNLKSEEIMNFYLIFLIYCDFYGNFFQKNCNVVFLQILLPVGGPIRLGKC